jgi:hypothetical protein
LEKLEGFMSKNPIGKSYMELCFHVDGGQNLYLRVPTVWDDIEKRWIGFVKTPKTQKLIHGEGRDSFELQNSFNTVLSFILEKNDEVSEEVFALFQQLSYWEEMECGTQKN